MKKTEDRYRNLLRTADHLISIGVYRKADPLVYGVYSHAQKKNDDSLKSAAAHMMVKSYLKQGIFHHGEGLFDEAASSLQAARDLINIKPELFPLPMARSILGLIDSELKALEKHDDSAKVQILFEAGRRWHERGNRIVIKSDKESVKQALTFWKYAIDKYERASELAKASADDRISKDYHEVALENVSDICSAAVLWSRHVDSPDLAIQFENIKVQKRDCFGAA